MQGFSKKAVEELNALKTSGNAKFNYGELAKKGGKFSAAAAGVYVAYKGIQSIFNGQ